VRFNHIARHLWTPTPDPSPQGGGEKRLRRIGKTRTQESADLITLPRPLRYAPRLRRRLLPIRARA
jgi:hypothetical protein